MESGRGQIRKPGKAPNLQALFSRLIAGLGGLFVLSVVVSLGQVVPVLYIMQIADRILQSKNLATLVFLSLITLWIILIVVVLEWIRSRALRRMALSIDQELAPTVFASASRPGKPGEFNLNLVSDVNNIRDTISGPLIPAAFDTILSPLFLAVLFIIHPWVGVVGTAIWVTLGLLSLANQFAVAKAVRESQTESRKEFEVVGAVMRNPDSVQGMGMAQGLSKKWGDVHARMLGWQGSAHDIAAVFRILTRFLRYSQMVLILGTATFLYLQREVGEGALFASFLVMTRAIGPIDQLFAGWRTITTARVAYQRLNAFLQTVDLEQRMKLPTPVGDLAAANLFAKAPGSERLIINDVSFRLSAGRVLGVIGQSGAGKSSLARLLIGSWRPLRGTVALDGHDYSHWDPNELGRHIGYVPQDIEFLPGTIGENIARFRDDEPGIPEAIVAAAARAGVEELIQSLPDGYNTVVGPGGYTLAGGQRQRIALARAVFGNPCLVLMDEPNSNLDSNGEEALGRTIATLRETGATIVLITHKLNLLVYCDEVLVLHEGSVLTHGSREEIMRRLPANQRLTTLRAVESQRI